MVELNRAIAVGMCDGPEVGLSLLDRVAQRLPAFPLVAAARADLLRRAGRPAEAATQYREAIALATSEDDRAQLTRRLDRLHG